jgi:hypothetical protein
VLAIMGTDFARFLRQSPGICVSIASRESGGGLIPCAGSLMDPGLQPPRCANSSLHTGDTIGSDDLPHKFIEIFDEASCDDGNDEFRPHTAGVSGRIRCSVSLGALVRVLLDVSPSGPASDGAEVDLSKGRHERRRT